MTNLDRIFTEGFVDTVHIRMFGEVWHWAGRHRKRITNIGVDPAQIVLQLRVTLTDARYWHDNDAFTSTERAVRFHHRLVSVHPFPNGNGRHARFMADIYLHLLGETRLGWGRYINDASAARSAYIAALHAADSGDYTDLVAFAAAS